MLTVPTLLRMPRRARAVAAALGTAQGGLNAVTDQPLAVRRLVAYRTHRSVDRAGLPVALGLPLLTGSIRDRRARTFFLAAGAALAAVYALTDWNAQVRRPADAEPQQPPFRQPGPQSRGSAGPDAHGTTDARSATDPATPAEGPADAAGPSAAATGADRPGGTRRPATVDSAPTSAPRVPRPPTAPVPGPRRAAGPASSSRTAATWTASTPPLGRGSPSYRMRPFSAAVTRPRAAVLRTRPSTTRSTKTRAADERTGSLDRDRLAGPSRRRGHPRHGAKDHVWRERSISAAATTTAAASALRASERPGQGRWLRAP